MLDIISCNFLSPWIVDSWLGLMSSDLAVDILTSLGFTKERRNLGELVNIIN